MIKKLFLCSIILCMQPSTAYLKTNINHLGFWLWPRTNERFWEIIQICNSYCVFCQSRWRKIDFLKFCNVQLCLQGAPKKETS